MVEPTKFRRGPDRRRQSRGGRRAGDLDGFAPLVLLVGEDHTVAQQAEAILCRLKFGVSVTTDPQEALRILPGLRPDVVIVAPRHEILLRTASRVPVVLLDDDNFDAMVDQVRRALRVTPIDRSAHMR